MMNAEPNDMKISTGRQEAVICIDDEAIILISLVQELKKIFGDRVLFERELCAEDALATIEELTNDGIRVQLIVTDLLMPGMKGDEFLEIVNRKYGTIKSILMTGLVEPATLGKVEKNESVIGVLKKPWRHADLVAMIETGLSSKKTRARVS